MSAFSVYRDADGHDFDWAGAAHTRLTQQWTAESHLRYACPYSSKAPHTGVQGRIIPARWRQALKRCAWISECPRPLHSGRELHLPALSRVKRHRRRGRLTECVPRRHCSMECAVNRDLLGGAPIARGVMPKCRSKPTTMPHRFRFASFGRSLPRGRRSEGDKQPARQPPASGRCVASCAVTSFISVPPPLCQSLPIRSNAPNVSVFGLHRCPLCR